MCPGHRDADTTRGPQKERCRRTWEEAQVQAVLRPDLGPYTRCACGALSAKYSHSTRSRDAFLFASIRNDVVSVSPPVCLTELLGSYAASGGAIEGGAHDPGKPVRTGEASTKGAQL